MELQQAWSLYDEVEYGNDNKELLALRYGFGIYQRHSYEQIGLICEQSQTWVMRRLEQVMSGTTLPAHDLHFKTDDASRHPFFRYENRLTTRQLHKLADILPSLDHLDVDLAIRLFGLGGRQQETVAEMNQRFFNQLLGVKVKSEC